MAFMHPAALTIGARRIGPGEPVFVIAEAGVNHNGDIALAQRLVDAAVAAGADAVKFQTFKAECVVTPGARKAEYQRKTTDTSESQLEMLRRLELSADRHRNLEAYCRQQGVLFISTPFDEKSADLLDELDVPLFKIASGEITNWPFLEYVARKGKPIILSTGMSYLSEVDEAVRVIHNTDNRQLLLLHCVSNYPAAPADANLRAMQTMAMALQVAAGYSDHTPGIDVALAAVALGACVIEKHLTLDKQLPGPDHRASLEPGELQALVCGIRTVERALGHGVKQPAASEANMRMLVRRSLAAAHDIPKGVVLTPDLLKTLRPASGISPALLKEVMGRKTRRSLKSDALVTWSDLA